MGTNSIVFVMLNALRVFFLLLFLLNAAYSQGISLEDFRRQFEGMAPESVPNRQSLNYLPPQEAMAQFEAISDSLYILGPGDVLTISTPLSVITSSLNPEGYLILESQEPMMLNGMNLAEAKPLIVQSLSKDYSRSQIFVTLSGPKKFRIPVTGAVANPGFYVVNHNTRLSEVVDMAGGFNQAATRILITKNPNHDSLKRIDLTDFFRKGEFDSNPLVLPGTAVHAEKLDATDPSVVIKEGSNIIRAKWNSENSLEDIIFYYDNFRSNRNWRFAKVYSGDTLVQVVDREKANEYFVSKGHTIEFHDTKPSVFISGAVARPGRYDYNSSFTALDYVSSAGAIPMTANFSRITVREETGKKKNTRQIENTQILPGDHINVPQSSEYKLRDYVSILLSVASIALAIANMTK